MDDTLHVTLCVMMIKALFLQGGPSARVPFWKISKAVDFVRQTEPGSACLVHCQHGLNRTGLVACAVAAQEIGLTAEEAMEAFSQIRPPGIQRQQVRRTLRKWLKWVRSGSPPAKKTRQPKKKNGRAVLTCKKAKQGKKRHSKARYE